ncbi:MAG: hypothetical protein N2689_09075 [Verrucomicrobiae bacterium]|nr:hypothetical protein [Verrucomicrobiae bacterium]
MHSTTMMKFLKVNHSVQLLMNQGRRFVLPSGPCFPQFGPKPHKNRTAINPPSPLTNDAGARFRRVGHRADIFDDDAATSSEGAAHESEKWSARLKARWAATVNRLFQGAPKS